MTETTGCFVVYSWDASVIVHSVHADELEALRAAVGAGYQYVAFVQWGADVREAINE